MKVAGALSLDRLAADPYTAYASLRRERPVAWIPELNMWWVTRYEDVRAVLLNDRDFVTGTPASLLYDTFGEHMLTVDGPRHGQLRTSHLNGRFMPASLRATAQGRIEARVSALLDGFVSDGRAELRQSFAARLPILVMLDIFGLPDDAELTFRAWYDAFEAALSNHAGSADVRARAADAVEAFHGVLQAHIDAWRAGHGRPGLLADVLSAPAAGRLSDAEIRRNALIIFFGGISTVEAVILNVVWALLTHPAALEQVRQNRERLGAVFDETHAGCRRSSPPRATPYGPARSPASASRPAPRSTACSLRPTATKRCSRIPTASISNDRTRTSISASPQVPTSAWAATWPAPKGSRRWAPCSTSATACA